jgi:hypothetical protein
VNTGWFPAQLSITAELRGAVWSGYLRTPRHRVELEDISAVWFRNPTAFRFPERWSRVERQHSHNEAKFGLGGVLTSVAASWINHPQPRRRRRIQASPTCRSGWRRPCRTGHAHHERRGFRA